MYLFSSCFTTGSAWVSHLSNMSPFPGGRKGKKKGQKDTPLKSVSQKSSCVTTAYTLLDTTRSHAYFLLQSSQERLLLLKHIVTQRKNPHSITEKDREKGCWGGTVSLINTIGKSHWGPWENTWSVIEYAYKTASRIQINTKKRILSS